MSIISAILEGQRDPVKLAQLRDKRCQSSEDQIALALEGTWWPEHLFELRQAYELYQFHHRQITDATSRSKPNWPISPTERERRRTLSSRGWPAQEQRRPVRRDGPVVPGVGCGPDLDRRDRRGNCPGDSG